MSASSGLLADEVDLGPTGFWSHSVVTAVASSVVARHLGTPVADAFSAGLLHDLGLAIPNLADVAWDAAGHADAADDDTPDAADRPKYLVRHGAMRMLGEFVGPDSPHALSRRAAVVVRTTRGIEFGEVLCPSSPQAVAHIPEDTKWPTIRCGTSMFRRRCVNSPSKASSRRKRPWMASFPRRTRLP